MPESESQRYLATLDAAARKKEVLLPKALDEVRRTGHTESFEEVDKGIWGAAAVVTVAGEGTFALGCAAPLYRNDDKRRTYIRELIDFGASELSEALSRQARGL
jgi:DNA-binding IclR family transcriptional regulator